ncbi:flagellar M-ring protein FliF [Mariprofundus ferrinatatus]|uniref:Flagellar M-ring protein n=1 Tax=Mariprofundus ferrinatatus TaxID=1921087 RepID=A0A2K8L9I9_9PROT|nr:flagellar basal-body MS-ring/collar protein FliF [Mariprofundus ferrinatatus]ATX82919.1 flagellar M-ring protein FliF [Mariprofundus ferrinatatus]
MANEIAPSQTQAVAANPSASASFSRGEQSFQASVSNIQGMLLKNRRLLLLIASILMLAGFISLLFWTADAPYRPLFSNIDEKEAASIIELLQKEKVPYRLEGGGTVLVPSDQVYALRLKLAGQDMLPGNKTGYELFDNGNQLGISDFVQNVNLQRALQGELARTIEILPQVSAARVHLVLPKESAFIKRKRKASASVMLQLAGSSRLSKQSILAIQNLIAAGVPELERDDVTVVDSAGNLLTTKGESNSPTSAVQTYQEYQMSFERRMEERLTRMLEQIVGAGQAVVRVSAEINREHVEQSNQIFNPDEAVLRSESVIEESRRASDRRASGIPGVASNTPGAQQADASQPQEEAGRKEHISSFEISSTTEKRIIPFGEVEKLSVAVLVGGNVATQEDGSSTMTPRSQDELKSIRGLVEKAMGYNEDRGDSLEVQSMSLVDISSNEDAAAMQDMEAKAYYLELARYGVAGLALLLLAWFVLRPLGKRVLVQDSDAGNVNDEQPALSGQPSDSVEAAIEAMQLSIGSENLEHKALQVAAKEMIGKDTQMAARIIQQWTRQS